MPFKSLRYRPGRAQIWGFNALRTNRWKNEISFLTRMPAGAGQQALQHGVAWRRRSWAWRRRPGSKNLEIKPYAISDLTSDLNASPRISNDLSGDVGVDVKYGLTQNLTADFTYNTDFAQVEADEQQVNLTRFSLFFPEKREFFLENQGTFAFGGAATSGQMALGGASDTPILFYSRRIGLNRGPGGADRGRRAPDRPARPVQPRRAEHSVRRRAGVGSAGDEFLGRAAEARHPAPEQRRRAVHGTIGRTRRRRHERGVRRRRDIRLLRQSGDQYVLGADAHRRPAGRGHQLSRAAGLRRRPLRRPAGAPRRRRQLQSGSRVRAARRHAPELRPVPVQPAAAVDQRRSASSRGPARWPTSRTAPAGWRRASMDGEFAIEFQNSDRFSVGVQRHLRVSPAPVPHRVRRHAARRRLRLRQRADRLQLRPAAAGVRQLRWPSTARSTAATRRRISLSRGRDEHRRRSCRSSRAYRSIGSIWRRARSRPIWSARASPTR